MIFLTAGELGIPSDSLLEPKQMARIRRAEAKAAAASLQASLKIFKFADLELEFTPLKEIVGAVLPLVRAVAADAIFSFDPFSTDRGVDHPDHNVAGQVARYVSAAADVKHFMPDGQLVQSRPELYLLTDDLARADVVVRRSAALNSKRNAYMAKYYPSQFRPEKKAEWTTFFNSRTEAYKRVR